MDFQPVLQALLYALVIGIPYGLYVALVSNRHERVVGGAPAQVFHALGSIGFASTLPAVLIQVFIVHGGFFAVLATGISCVLLSLALLLAHAVFEQPARARLAPAEDQGWTAEKAKSSGL